MSESEKTNRDLKLARLILESMVDPSVVGATDETLSTDHFAAFDSGLVKYHFSMLLNHGCFLTKKTLAWYDDDASFSRYILSWVGHDLLESLRSRTSL